MTNITKQQAIEWISNNIVQWPAARSISKMKAPHGWRWRISFDGNAELFNIESCEVITCIDWMSYDDDLHDDDRIYTAIFAAVMILVFVGFSVVNALEFIR